jgi:ribonuclease VapC
VTTRAGADEPLQPTCVLDASALLAYLQDEPGGERVRAELKRALMSSVNWSEVLQKALAYGTDIHNMRQDLESLGLEIVDFDAQQAEATAEVWATSKSAGLSLADRACLALAQSRRLPALTSDAAWAKVSSHVRMIR